MERLVQVPHEVHEQPKGNGNGPGAGGAGVERFREKRPVTRALELVSRAGLVVESRVCLLWNTSVNSQNQRMARVEKA